MHHSESPGGRRMSHPSVSGSDEQQTSAQPPPHSLSLQPAATQLKKKSGFQITSVLPAQGSSASASNSLAEDTESYDDMDESHTEDLSSSDILDVSVSRATDTGVPERSSSEETLNSLQGGETPGVASPNEPVMQQGYLVNGVHHHHHKTGRPAAASAIPASSGRSVQAAEAGGAAPVPDAARAPVPTVMPVAPANPPTASAATTASRFRVVKLDSNTEPFRKGRWTCTEYYEKDAPAGDVAAAAHRAVESVLQSEHETTSGSSSGSTLSGGGDVQQACVGLHAPDPGAHLLPPPSVLSGAESSSASGRPYSVEAQSSYPASTRPPVEYTPRPASVQPAAQSAVSPRAVPGLPPGAVSPRPQVPGPQMSINPDPTGAQLFSSAALSHLQPLLLRAPLLPAGPAYVTASQLEDAQRLLLQHHTLLSLPRLAAGGMAGLAGPAASDAAAAVSSADEDRLFCLWSGSGQSSASKYNSLVSFLFLLLF
ncbi:TSC22 domain family protein 1-like isoform X2 [Sinocyclocheilus grahami]|uniref:TSC22 domain family protein 1-like isoform X2 n=1 Tax=Sinocyclocheilus grahami TaxID=75366 RepID=UPI0007AD2D34|nr:PREDICTED: TSC22 domain family protein 1-like isoform X2 [Sinocyclocheilus grahami]